MASDPTHAATSHGAATRDDLRNIAIVAHVDHGKTTLVDAMLHQSGTFRANQDVDKRVMDSMDLEREKGITILAKHTAVRLPAADGHDEVKITIVDTPGHADFGGEVERALTMVDGILLLVDAAEGPLPQTRFVLRKAMSMRPAGSTARGLPMILVINKIDRPDARPAEVVDEVYELLFDLDVDEDGIDFPIVYTNAKAGTSSLSPDEQGPDLGELFGVVRETIPAPTFDPEMPLQALVTNLDASPYLGRLALCRVHNGTVTKGQQVAWIKEGGDTESVRVAELFTTEGLERISVDDVGPGGICAIAGIDQVMIGDTLADLEDPRPLPGIRIDEPTLAMTIGINTSPLSGRSGDKVTARQLKDRLDRELIGNVSLRVSDTDRPDAWEVKGRGELQLAILVEQMRREGFELTVGKPQVIPKEIDGTRHEPVETVTVDVPEEHSGTVTQLLAERRGIMTAMTNHGTGWVRAEYRAPTRGLIGFRTEFLTATRGTGVLNRTFEEYVPWMGDVRTRATGSLVADRKGPTTSFALQNLADRGVMFVGPGEEVYEGMIVGENSRAEDMDLNVTKEKKLNNIRSATGEELVRLTPPKKMALEQSLEWMRGDECVEVTPDAVRLRKVDLDQVTRARAARQAKSDRLDAATS
ncbi:translational GTPase TypA [Euzebya tangerina]|uniref:translational GTPase TypA n=1 Tax=Euzebya tangerina TaxID=591198 RepID=UPI000E31AD7C|nr:translational GTPase TypA [Euzebya tangerina]